MSSAASCGLLLTSIINFVDAHARDRLGFGTSLKLLEAPGPTESETVRLEKIATHNTRAGMRSHNTLSSTLSV